MYVAKTMALFSFTVFLISHMQKDGFSHNEAYIKMIY